MKRDMCGQLNNSGYLVFLLGLFLINLAQGQTNQSTVQFEAAKVLENRKPVYPQRLVRIGAESRVTVNFMIDANGEVFEPTVVESYGSESFEFTALSAISDTTFEPATFNGEPVESASYRTYNFSVSGGGYETRRTFESTYYSFMESVASVESAQGYELLQELESLEARNHFESAHLNLARYRFAELHGSMVDQKHFLSAALINTITLEGVSEDFYVEENFVEPLLKRLMSIQVESRDYRPALNTINRLVDYSSTESRDGYLGLVQEMLKIRDDDSSYAMPENIPQSGRRIIPLFKGSFYFDSLDGDLAEIKLRCQQKYLFFAFDIESSYEIPESYGRCGLEVIGDPGTTFDLVQF